MKKESKSRPQSAVVSPTHDEHNVCAWHQTAAGWFSFASIVIALFAVAFTALQYQDAHNQLLLSIKPHLSFDTEDDIKDPPVGIAIDNAGPGPAIIRSMTYYVDRKPLQDSSRALDFGKINFNIVNYMDLEPDDAIAVGGRYWLLKLSTPRAKGITQKDINNFIDFIDQRVAIEVEFCTAMGNECWVKCSTKDRCR